jgi:hypothetical protein
MSDWQSSEGSTALQTLFGMISRHAEIALSKGSLSFFDARYRRMYFYIEVCLTHSAIVSADILDSPAESTRTADDESIVDYRVSNRCRQATTNHGFPDRHRVAQPPKNNEGYHAKCVECPSMSRWDTQPNRLTNDSSSF